MPLFAATYKVLPEHRSDCVTYFGTMEEADDLKVMGPDVKLLGRWHSPADATRLAVFDAKDAKSAQKWLFNWSENGMCDIQVSPVMDDNEHCEMILGQKPSWTLDMTHVGDEAMENETIFHIRFEWCSKEDKMKAFEMVGALTEEAHFADRGDCRPLGIWHEPSKGVGHIVAVAPSSRDVLVWCYHWASVCTCDITQVVTKEARETIREKEGFAEKATALEKKMNMKPEVDMQEKVAEKVASPIPAMQ